MRTVDEILQQAEEAPPDPEAVKTDLPRYPRSRNIKTVRELSQVNGYRTTFYLIFQWSVIIAAFAAAGYTGHWLVYIIASFVIASRLQALSVIVHEGAHYLLYKNRTTNDVVSDLFAAFPLGIATSLYRKTHLRHHFYLNGEEDQDRAAHEQDHEWHDWPKTHYGFWITMIRTAFGLNAHKGWTLYKYWAPWANMRSPDFPRSAKISYMINLACVYGAFAVCLKLHPMLTISLLVLFGVTGMTTLNIVGRIRATSEHFGTEGTHELNATRTIVPGLLERATLAPYGVSYHLEHHLFPSVPGYKLQHLHNELMKDEEYRENAHVTYGYAAMFGEIMQSKRPDSVSEEPEPA